MADHDSHHATPVTIFGRTYHLRGGGDPEYLQELASTVDVTIREIADATGTADSLKLAILACLNLADENMKARQTSGGRGRGRARAAHDRDTQRRMAALVSSLDEVLAE